MKNNIILILIVTVISIAVIVISIAVSAGNRETENSSSHDSKPAVTTQKTTTDPPEDTSEPDVLPQQTTSAASNEAELPSEPDRVTDSQTSADIISVARSLIGTDFVDGGDSPAFGFDNSGFIYYVLRENGYITCPRGVSAQAEMGAAIGFDELQPGDLVFFSESGVSVEFGGIYAGSGVMIACLMPGTQVKEVNITTDYYTRNFYRGVAIS
ncbi:MAG: C40 family peptidase [Oscillospiraceae bacterium]